MIKTKVRPLATIILASIIVGLFIVSSRPIVAGPLCLVLLYFLFQTYKVATFQQDHLSITWPLLFKNAIISREQITGFRIQPYQFGPTSPSIVLHFSVGSRHKKIALELNAKDIEPVSQLLKDWNCKQVFDK